MKMNVKTLLAATLFATAGFLAQSAQAAVPTYTAPLDLSSYSADFGNTVLGTGTIFVDHYTFTVGASELDAGFYANQGKKDGSTISGFNLLDSVGNVVATGSGSNGGWNIAPTVIGAGSYALEVIGSVTGTLKGSYSGTLNVSAVPEPETYGMMLGGLALLGVVARRKAKKAA